jgi:hypothetical protein
VLRICNARMISTQDYCASGVLSPPVMVRAFTWGDTEVRRNGSAESIAVSYREQKFLCAMSTIDRITFSGGTAKVGIWAREHCPPHATVRETTDEWTMKIEFSFINENVDLWKIRALKSLPAADAVNAAIDAVRNKRREYRTLWWKYQEHNVANRRQGGPCCLNNKTIPRGEVASATYDPTKNERTLHFKDGTSITEPATP